MTDATVRAQDVPPGTVTRSGDWAVGTTRDGRHFAVSRRCRHQFADLSEGGVSPDGCLVCPWHQSAYDVETGRMVRGPKGLLAYHGPAPGYSAMIKAYARFLPLRRAIVERTGDLLRIRRH